MVVGLGKARAALMAGGLGGSGGIAPAREAGGCAGGGMAVGVATTSSSGVFGRERPWLGDSGEIGLTSCSLSSFWDDSPDSTWCTTWWAWLGVKGLVVGSSMLNDSRGATLGPCEASWWWSSLGPVVHALSGAPSTAYAAHRRPSASSRASPAPRAYAPTPPPELAPTTPSCSKRSLSWSPSGGWTGGLGWHRRIPP